jgi:hypothetical protein
VNAAMRSDLREEGYYSRLRGGWEVVAQDFALEVLEVKPPGQSWCDGEQAMRANTGRTIISGHSPGNSGDHLNSGGGGWHGGR